MEWAKGSGENGRLVLSLITDVGGTPSQIFATIIINLSERKIHCEQYFKVVLDSLDSLRLDHLGKGLTRIIIIILFFSQYDTLSAV